MEIQSGETRGFQCPGCAGGELREADRTRHLRGGKEIRNAESCSRRSHQRGRWRAGENKAVESQGKEENNRNHGVGVNTFHNHEYEQLTSPSFSPFN